MEKIPAWVWVLVAIAIVWYFKPKMQALAVQTTSGATAQPGTAMNETTYQDTPNGEVTTGPRVATRTGRGHF